MCIYFFRQNAPHTVVHPAQRHIIISLLIAIRHGQPPLFLFFFSCLCGVRATACEETPTSSCHHGESRLFCQASVLGQSPNDTNINIGIKIEKLKLKKYAWKDGRLFTARMDIRIIRTTRRQEQKRRHSSCGILMYTYVMRPHRAHGAYVRIAYRPHSRQQEPCFLAACEVKPHYIRHNNERHNISLLILATRYDQPPFSLLFFSCLVCGTKNGEETWWHHGEVGYFGQTSAWLANRNDTHIQ